MILADPRNPTAQSFQAQLTARGLDRDDLTFVVGGDGWMLHCVRTHGTDRTYLGLNAGRVGFLMNDVADWDLLAAQLQAEAWTVHEAPRLVATIDTADGSTHTAYAVNDVYLERATGQTAHLALSIDGAQVVDPLVSDGLIFSTALGSTAYTFSAGGPACHPTLRVIAVTAICPHHPRLSPFLLPDRARATVQVQARHRRPVRAVVDGLGIPDVVSLQVATDPTPVRLAYLEGHAFTTCMVHKILRP